MWAVVFVDKATRTVKFMGEYNDEGAAQDECDFHTQSVVSGGPGYHVVSLYDNLGALLDLMSE